MTKPIHNYMYVCMYVYIYIYIYIYSSRLDVLVRHEVLTVVDGLYNICVYIYIYIYMYVNT